VHLSTAQGRAVRPVSLRSGFTHSRLHVHPRATGTVSWVDMSPPCKREMEFGI